VLLEEDLLPPDGDALISESTEPVKIVATIIRNNAAKETRR